MKMLLAVDGSEHHAVPVKKPFRAGRENFVVVGFGSIHTSLLEEVFGVREVTIRTWLCPSGMQGKKLHEHFMGEPKRVVSCLFGSRDRLAEIAGAKLVDGSLHHEVTLLQNTVCFDRLSVNKMGFNQKIGSFLSRLWSGGSDGIRTMLKKRIPKIAGSKY
jgi:hypothetical protein